MSNNGEYTNLEQLLICILIISKEDETIYLDDILNAAGQKSFGTILLMTGIITLAPLIGYIPGVPTTFGLSLLARDGLLALIAYFTTSMIVVFIVYRFI